MIENMTKEEIAEFKESIKPHKFIRENNLEQLEILINNGLDVNKINSHGNLLLATAIICSNIEAVKLLVGNGADVNLTVNNLPLITLALSYGDIELFRLLIENGADINAVANNQPIILNALLYGNNEAVKLLVENGADIEFENFNTNLLEHALLFSNDEIIELCISKGSKFSQDIIFDVAKAKDGYVFNREEISKLVNEKNEFRKELYSLEQNCEKLIQIKESTIEVINKIKGEKYEMNKGTNTEEENIIIDNIMQKDDIEISKHSLELNKLHNRLNNIRKNISNMINRISDMQDKMTTLKIIDFIKIFIQYGGNVNHEDENASTPLMLLSNYGYKDCVKLLIENGAQIDIKNSSKETPLLFAYENNHFHIVKLLIESGADVNITMYNGKSFYKKAKYDKNYEVLDWIENSPTYTKITHEPEELVRLLSNFTIDKPIKYTTHDWDFGELKKEYGNFDGYMDAVKKQFDTMKNELEEFSPNLYKKIYTFLIEENPDENYSWCHKTHINIGWSSLKGLKEYCDAGNKPDNFILSTPILYEGNDLTTFKDIINLFKQEIEIRENFKNLETLFTTQKNKLGTGRNSIFNLDLSIAKLNRQFYTDVEKFSNVLDKIFGEIKIRKDFPNLEVITTELEDRSIEIKIVQIDSISNKSASDLLKEIDDGDFAEIKLNLLNLCDWSIEGSFENENFRINYLHSNNEKEIVSFVEKPKGFTHIFRFYK